MSPIRVRRRTGERTGRSVYVLSAALGAIALFGYLAVVRGATPISSRFEIPWLVLAAGFAISDRFAIHVEFGDNAHSFNLNELPFVLGLFLCDPRMVVLARVLAACAVLTLLQRQTMLKLVFNISLAALESVLVVAVFVVLRPLSGDGPGAWIVALAATGAVTVLQTVAILTAVRLAGGRPEPRQAISTGVFGIVSAAATASLAVATVALLDLYGGAGAAISAVIGLVLFSAYRAYAVISQRYASVTKLYGFTKALAHSSGFDSAVRVILLEACDLLRAESAELCLLDRQNADKTFLRVSCIDSRVDIDVEEDLAADWLRNEVIVQRHGIALARHTRNTASHNYLTEHHIRDVAIVPLIHTDTVVGTLAVYNRRGEVSTFDDDDLTVFETLANHAMVSLDNANLIGKLRQEVADRRHQALHDPLTGLGNRTLLAEQIDAALAERPDDKFVATLLMDLNRFKDVNDTLGHQHGDALLCDVASRLRASAPDNATITRFGGDEFAILLPEIASTQDAVEVATRVRSCMVHPFHIDDLHLTVGGSIGIAVAPLHGDNTDLLLQHADIAMYQAKDGSDDTGIALYDNAQNQHSQRRLSLATELRTAIDDGALEVHYQPKADLETGQAVGVEALVRWQHPSYGAIPPDEFVPLAERTGLIRPLTLLVLTRALTQLRYWHELGLEQLHVAVNLSARSLLSSELANDVEQALRTANLPPHALTLEITETQMMADPTRTVRILDQLSALGVRIAIDDFGTGYSSLSYLQRLPAHELKIDKSFVIDMTITNANRTIVQTIIDLGRNLNLRVVAEGIEDAITWEALAALGCDIGQGYFLSRPSPPTRLTPWLLARTQETTTSPDPHRRPLRAVS